MDLHFLRFYTLFGLGVVERLYGFWSTPRQHLQIESTQMLTLCSANPRIANGIVDMGAYPLVEATKYTSN